MQRFPPIHTPMKFFFIQIPDAHVSTHCTYGRCLDGQVGDQCPPPSPSNRCRRAQPHSPSCRDHAGKEGGTQPMTPPQPTQPPACKNCSAPGKLTHPKPRIETVTIHRLCFLGSRGTSQPPGTDAVEKISCEKSAPVNDLRKTNRVITHPALKKNTIVEQGDKKRHH